MTKRKRYSAGFRAKVASEAIGEELTTAELARKYALHPTMITGRKRTAILNMAAAFGSTSPVEPQISAGKVEKLPAKTGQLVIERDFCRQPPVSSSVLEAKSGEAGSPRSQRPAALARSGLYYPPRGESAETLAIIGRQFHETPWSGSRQMARHMRREGHCCGRHRVRRLMRLM